METTMKILIATDGSSASKSVVEAACGIIVSPENTTVKIISAVEPITPMAAEPFAISAEYYNEIEADLSRQAKNIVEQAVTVLKEICPKISDVSSQVLHGSAAQMIVETARQWNADLIIVGSHGYGVWSRILLGSVSNTVVHQAPCSVLIVRGKNSP
jgi:nucleotide-binding universal stress UspA family protein